MTGFEVPPDVTVPSVQAATGGTEPMSPAEIFALVDPTLDWDDLAELVESCSLPVILKGVMTEEDARLAVDAGAAGLVVSNHGGRQLDRVNATIDALPEVADAVEGRIEVLMDGGVRRGTDVLTALALGARAVLVGRPALWGLAAGGRGRGATCADAAARRDRPGPRPGGLPEAGPAHAGTRSGGAPAGLTARACGLGLGPPLGLD